MSPKLFPKFFVNGVSHCQHIDVVIVIWWWHCCRWLCRRQNSSTKCRATKCQPGASSEPRSQRNRRVCPSLFCFRFFVIVVSCCDDEPITQHRFRSWRGRRCRGGRQMHCPMQWFTSSLWTCKKGKKLKSFPNHSARSWGRSPLLWCPWSTGTALCWNQAADCAFS